MEKVAENLSIREVAMRVLNPKGVYAVEAFLDDDDEQGAKDYVLGVIDRLWEEGEIPDDVAKLYYASLGVPKDEAAQLRQQRDVS